MATTQTVIDVKGEKLSMTVLGQIVDFKMFGFSSIPSSSCSFDECNFLDAIDPFVNKIFAQDFTNDELEAALTLEKYEVVFNAEIGRYLGALDEKFLEILEQELLELPKNPTEEELAPPPLEIKELPSHLKYVFLGEGDTNPVIIYSTLTPPQETKVIEVLGKYRKAIGWSISDIRGISPTMCIHQIVLEDDTKHVRQPQRR